MSAVKKALVNSALALLGEVGVDDLAVSPAPPRLAKMLAALDGEAGVYDWVLRQHGWLCAMAYATLSRAARDGNWKYANVYDLPISTLRVWEVQGAGKHHFGQQVVSGVPKKVIWSDAAGGIDVAYVERCAPEVLSADILSAMAHELAGRTAGPIQGKYDKGKALSEKAAALIARAISGEANEEGGQDVLVASEFAALRASAG